MNPPDLSLDSGSLSEKGLREENQDRMSAFWTPLGMVYILADGMGGHHGGAEAARRVVEGYQVHLGLFRGPMETVDILQAATRLTNSDILHVGRSGDAACAGMGSTVVLAMLRTIESGVELLVGHIGDSRAYLLRDGSLRQLTHDHSVVQRMVDEGLISAEEGRTHRSLNVLSRALGKQPDVELEIGALLLLRPDDVVLLCTDGLWGSLTDAQLLHELSIDRPALHAAETLVQLALEAGSEDNITVQILRMEERAVSSGLMETASITSA
jgi:PPM family protein phosphatase